jgi:hypothetical protein
MVNTLAPSQRVVGMSCTLWQIHGSQVAVSCRNYFLQLKVKLDGLGHFERRISFGYDADLSQVRAEFDGEHLRVFIPRRTTLMNCWSSNE